MVPTRVGAKRISGPGGDAFDRLVLVEAGLGQPVDLIVLALTDQGGVDRQRVLKQGAEGVDAFDEATFPGTGRVISNLRSSRLGWPSIGTRSARALIDVNGVKAGLLRFARRVEWICDRCLGG